MLRLLSLKTQFVPRSKHFLSRFFAVWSMHFLKVNEKTTNALIIQCIGTQYSHKCFGTLKCHHQGVKHDPAEIDAQCRGKQRKMA
jgi:hypothetical protein